jgi:uncharacterized protein (DUF362 family)
MTNVAVIHGDERRENVRRAFELVLPAVLEKLKAAPNMLVKPNLVHHENQLASTHVDAVRGVLDVVRAHTQAPVTVGDASYHGTKTAFRNFGYELLPTEYPNVELFDLNDDTTVMGWYVKRDGTKGTMGISKRVAEAGFTIDLAVMKTHRDVGVSLAVKNWTIGTWVAQPRNGARGRYWPRWPFLHEQGAWAHNMTIAELLGQLKPSVGIIDAFLAMEGDGPTRGHAVERKLALAGTDVLALDTVGCRLMGIDPNDIGCLVFAKEKGYGAGDESAIQLAGETDVGKLAHVFQKPEGWNENVLSWRDRENLKLV